ncbi:DUF397 domain-containing protein [Streptomyces cinereoruber]|uniref:DUF397 domain-containing protein n=1 Tax=Streptomyces cinereoruber TaxID=67260 RepID=UPI003BF4D9C7
MNEHTISDASALSGWRKSSYSGNESGSCVEVLDGYWAGVPVRDSKIPRGQALIFRDSSWTPFITSIKNASA